MALADFSKLRIKDDPKITLQVDRFNGGVNTLMSAPRLKENEAVEARNLMLVEDGLWTKRWGSAVYGGVLAGSKIDGFAEYRATDGDRELLAFSGGIAQKRNASAWNTVSGYTPTVGLHVYTIQIGNKLYVCNGTDPLARYDGTDFSEYVPLSPPTGLKATKTNLTTGNYTYYGKVTAHNEVGETIGTTEVSCSVNKLREEWVKANNEYVVWEWDTVPSATSYTFYLSDASNQEAWMADIYNDSLSWKDVGNNDGESYWNDYILPPLLDGTSGPKFRYMCISDNRLWGTGDPQNPWRVYWTGRTPYLGDFNWDSGGGWVDLEEGGKSTTGGIVDFQGRPCIFCPTPDGRGAIWQISLTLETTWDYYYSPTVSKVTNQISSTAPLGIIQAENDVFFPTKRGIYILGNEKGVTSNVLRTNELSARIRDFMEGISQEDLEAMCAYYKDGKVFFSTPSKMFYYDRERTCWVKDWSIGFSQLGDFTDENGVTHFIAAGTDTPYLYEISANILGDSGKLFNTSFLSAQLSTNKDWTKFSKITKAFVNLGKPVGSINLEILGIGKNGSFSTLASRTITPGISNAGLGWDRMGDCLMGDSAGSPTTYAQASTIRYMKINKLLRSIQFHITTNTIDSQYVLLGFLVQGFPVQTGLPSSYKLS